MRSIRAILPVLALCACEVDVRTGPTDAGSAPDSGALTGDSGAPSTPDTGALAPDATTSGRDTGTTPAADTGGSTPDAAASDLPAMVSPNSPAVSRGGQYRGFPERFNRYYTEPGYTPAKTVYVSPTGSGNGAARATPSSVASAFASVQPGTRIHFLPGSYSGCFELDSDHGGTYDQPVVLYGERAPDGRLGVTVQCCATGRQTCFNLEAASYVAIDGFELVGGSYGVRAVGADYASSQHQRGVAVLHCDGHGQNKDPFFTGASDWLVIERCLGHDAGTGDGHGIYLSNGSDWNIVRFNELWNNRSSDFQINADPASTCTDVGIDVSTPDCDAVAGTPGDGGRGASDFMLVEGNYFHDGLAQGANFTSARNGVVRDNIFAVYAKHGVSFWQETSNPRLGASGNYVAHNLFVATVANRQMLQFVEHSDRNVVENNVFVGAGTGCLAMEVDDTVGANVYTRNAYYSATLSGRTPNATELQGTLDKAWFRAFPTAATNDPTVFQPTASAPFLDQGALLPAVTLDREGTARKAPTDLGPFERP